jgi:predicted ABC-type transport system involved in lysophospholipase L1 biosynthesis ATPase subunit
MSDPASDAPAAAPAASTAILQAQGLRKRYRVGSGWLEVLRGVDLELHVGEVVALTGTSGSGKSTLLHLLGLMDRADQGEILLRGRPIHRLRQQAAARLRAGSLGFVFQQFQLLEELSALENVLLPRRIACGRSWRARRHEERQAAARLLGEVGLGERLKHRPMQLSGGEQQRVALARALVSSPPVLFADEPTGNLDRRTGEEVLELLLGMARERGTAVLLATHDLNIAGRCDQRLHLRDGAMAEVPA